MKNPFRGRRIRTEKDVEAFFSTLHGRIERREALSCRVVRRGREARLLARTRRGKLPCKVVVHLRYDQADGAPAVVFRLRPHLSEIAGFLVVAALLMWSALGARPEWLPEVALFPALWEVAVFVGYLAVRTAQLFDVRATAFDAICSSASGS